MRRAAFHVKLFYPLSRTLRMFLDLQPPLCSSLLKTVNSGDKLRLLQLFLCALPLQRRSPVGPGALNSPPGTTKVREERKFLSHMGARVQTGNEFSQGRLFREIRDLHAVAEIYCWTLTDFVSSSKPQCCPQCSKPQMSI